jgi:deoxyribonuclease-1
MRSLALILLVGCAAVDDVDRDDALLAGHPDSFSWRTRILGPIAPGESRGPVRYEHAPTQRYLGYEVQAQAGDPIDLWVRSPDGDAVAWVLEEDWAIRLKSKNVSSTDTSAHLVGTFRRSGRHYIVFREYDLEDADFTVALAGGDDPYGDLEGEPLRARLHDDVTRPHHPVTYDHARDFVYAMDGLETIETGELESQYTGVRTWPDGTNTPGDFNTEHTWPQSKGADEEPMRGDLHHLFATHQGSNSARSNHEFGETRCDEAGQPACSWSTGGSQLGRDARQVLVFEVRPERRGEAARAIFYFAVRYDMPVDAAEEAVLRRWHAADPPSAWERRRVEMVEAIQGNQNPFVLYPQLVERIADY